MKKRPAKFRTLSNAESAICERLRALRKDHRLTQAEFGERLKVSRDSVASIETKRIPVFAMVGFAACKSLGICQRWLATGLLPKRPFIPVHDHLLSKAEVTSEFGIFYRSIANAIDHRLAELANAAGCKIEELDSLTAPSFTQEPIGFSIHEALKASLAKQIAKDMDLLPDDLTKAYAEALSKTASTFLQKHRERIWTSLVRT